MSQHVARGQGGHGPVPEETGSTPVRASNWLQWLEWTGARFLLGSMRVRILLGAPNACVAQRMSARVLSGMTLVRLQSQAPMTTSIWRVNRRGLRRRLLSGRSVRRWASCAQLSAKSKRVWDIGSSSPFQGDDVGSIPTARTNCSLPLMAGDLTFNQATTDRNRQGAPPTADPPARSGAFEASQERSTRSSAANARAPGSGDLS